MVAEGYKKTEIGVIPVEWDVVKLETICDVRDGTHDSPKYQENGIPFITSKHLTDNGVDFSDVNYISNEDHINFSKRSLVENGDILFGMIGTIGKPLIVNYDFEFSIKNVALLKFKNNTKLSNSFILNLLKSTIIDKQFSKLSNGGVQSFIALGMIRSLKIPLPPLKEQEKIADILCSADDKIDTIALQIEKAETLKKGLLQKLLSEGIGHSEFKDSELGKIPLGWEVVKLGDMSEHISYGLTVRPKYIKEGIPLISATEIKNGLIDYTNAPKISDKDFNKLSNKAKPMKGDIFLSKTGTIGRVSYVQSDEVIAITQNIAVIRLDDKIYFQKFIIQYMRTQDFQKSAIKKVNQSTIMDLQLQDIRKLLIPTPPLKEQKQIAQILSTADEKLEVLRAKKEKFETLKKGLLQKLLSGEVRV